MSSSDESVQGRSRTLSRNLDTAKASQQQSQQGPTSSRYSDSSTHANDKAPAVTEDKKKRNDRSSDGLREARKVDATTDHSAKAVGGSMTSSQVSANGYKDPKLIASTATFCSKRDGMGISKPLAMQDRTDTTIEQLGSAEGDMGPMRSEQAEENREPPGVFPTERPWWEEAYKDNPWVHHWGSVSDGDSDGYDSPSHENDASEDDDSE